MNRWGKKKKTASCKLQKQNSSNISVYGFQKTRHTRQYRAPAVSLIRFFVNTFVPESDTFCVCLNSREILITFSRKPDSAETTWCTATPVRRNWRRAK